MNNLSLENLDGEVWKDIDNYIGSHQISNMWRVKSLARIDTNNHPLKERILRSRNEGSRCLTIDLWKNGQKKQFLIYDLVMSAFSDNLDKLPYKNHPDFIRLYNKSESLCGEIWCDIPEYEGLYQVSNLARIKSLDRHSNSGHKLKGKILKLYKDKKGYLCRTLCKNGKLNCFKVHRLVALVFVPNPHNHPQALHINDDRNNNTPEGLYWGTPKQNVDDIIKNHGYKNRSKGEKHKMSKLTNEEVIEIRRLFNSSLFNLREIAQLYNIKHCTVHSIGLGKTWKHLLNK